jgi:hypothetical protein
METLEKQTKLNELVAEKIQRKINSGLSNIEVALDKLTREGKIMQDFIAPVGSRVRGENQSPVMTFAGNGKVIMNVKSKGDFAIHDNALSQLSAKLGVPLGYVKGLNTSDWGRHLLSDIFNTHSYHTERERVLIRAVGYEARAVLSDHYRRIDSGDIIRTFLESVQVEGGVVADAFMSDTRLWVETIMPEPIVIPTERNGDVYIAFGARLSTSDYGDGALDMRSFMMQGVCLNGAVSNSVLRAVHLGQRLDENILYSESTYRKDTDLQCSKVKDITNHLFNPRFIRDKAMKIQEAASIEVDIRKSLSDLNKSLAITKGEADEVLTIISNNKLEDGVQGENTLLKLAQGLAAMARDKDQTRKREIEELSGKIMLLEK